jgi:hypothetical protein
MGSRSMRAGISWLVLGALCNEGTETLMDCFERTGVERLMDGRLRAAGLMSTMAGARDIWPTTDKRAVRDAVDTEREIEGVRTVACGMLHSRGANPRSFAHQNVGRAHAIRILDSNRWIGHGGAAEGMIFSSAGWTEVVRSVLGSVVVEFYGACSSKQRVAC